MNLFRETFVERRHKEGIVEEENKKQKGKKKKWRERKKRDKKVSPSLVSLRSLQTFIDSKEERNLRE